MQAEGWELGDSVHLWAAGGAPGVRGTLEVPIRPQGSSSTSTSTQGHMLSSTHGCMNPFVQALRRGLSMTAIAVPSSKDTWLGLRGPVPTVDTADTGGGVLRTRRAD